MKKYLTKLWLILVCICITITLVFFVGCSCFMWDKPYRGDYPELYSVAINSLLGAQGFAFTGDLSDSQIELIEEDDYGRLLFVYYEGRKISTYSLLIMQKADNNYTYFYSDYNFISVYAFLGTGINFLGKHKEYFTEESINKLKELNDWNKEIEESKCIKVEIVRKKEYPSINDSILKSIFKEALQENSGSFGKNYMMYLTTDNYGRVIYLATGRGVYMVILFNSDGSYNEETFTMELTDLYNYQDQLKAFKDLNNWNQPL